MPEHDNSHLGYLNQELLNKTSINKPDVYELIDTIAESFYKDTGYYCPIKDHPVGANYNPQATDAERKRLWDIYMRAFYRGIEWQCMSAGEDV